MVLEAGGSRPLVHPNKICTFRFSTIRFDLLEWRSVIAPLAQLVEQRTLNPQVLGSNPRGGTIVMYEMNAIILCGGQGIRLRPLTEDIPKPLVHVRGRPIIDFIIEFLRNQNVTEITIAGGYLVEKLEQHFVDDNHVKVIDTGDCDIIERLKLLLTDDTKETLVVYGDTLSDVNLKELVEAHQNSRREVTVTVWPLKSSFGVFDLDASSNVTSYAEKPELDKWINIGYFVLSKSAINNLQKFTSFEAFLSDLTSRRQLHAFQHRSIQATINSWTELEEAESELIC